MSAQPQVTAGQHLTCSRAVASAEEGALGPLKCCLYPGGAEREGSKGLEPQTSLAHYPLPFSHLLLPSLPAASSPVSTVARSLKPGLNGRENDLVESLLSMLRPKESLNMETQRPVYLPQVREEKIHQEQILNG